MAAAWPRNYGGGGETEASTKSKMQDETGSMFWLVLFNGVVR